MQEFCGTVKLVVIYAFFTQRTVTCWIVEAPGHWYCCTLAISIALHTHEQDKHGGFGQARARPGLTFATPQVVMYAFLTQRV